MIGGRIAGEIAARAIKNESWSAKDLKDYKKRCQDEVGQSFKKYLKAKEYLLNLSDEELDSIAEAFQKTDFDVINTSELIKKLIKVSPKALLKLGKIF
jgi:digeranylgeranylglycerophospholipid reductase